MSESKILTAEDVKRRSLAYGVKGREILHVQVGQCGNQVGTAFLKSLCKEHHIDAEGKWNPPQPYKFQDDDGDGLPDELEGVSIYMKQVKDANIIGDARFVTRSVVVDLEPGTKETIRNDPQIKNLISEARMLNGANGAGNNWAKGHYTEGAELVEAVLDGIRQETEQCECPQGFQLFHSLGGGTGSGMGTLLLLKIRDAYPDRITSTYSVFPSPKVSDTVVEPYNAVLSSHQLLENSDETFMIDNEALYHISQNIYGKNAQPEYEKLNKFIASVVLGITASLRFPGTLNGDLRKLGVNLVPFPRLHFFLLGHAPLKSKDASAKSKTNVADLISSANSKKNFFSNINPEDGKVLSAAFNFRGRELSEEEVDSQVEKYQKKAADDFVDWIPSNLKTSIVKAPPVDSSSSMTMVSNTCALKSVFQRLATQFGAMYRRKAFLHWYKGEGMDEMEFQEADKNVRDLITEYQDKHDATYEEEDSEGEEEEGDEDDI